MTPPSADADTAGANSGSGSGAIGQLDHLQKTWNNIVLTGKPNGLAEKPDLLTSLEQIGVEFGQLRRELSGAFAESMQREAAVELGMRAQIAIDILVRNLFERTADVGFLAEDTAIIDSLLGAEASPDPTALQSRLEAYIAKYSVYDDIAIYRPDGGLHLTRLGVASRFAAHDPLVAEARAKPGTFHEVFRLERAEPSRLLYAQTIQAERAPGSKQTVGILVLSFRFDDEMAGIFADLLGAGGGAVVLAIIDATGAVLAASDETILPRGQSLKLTSGTVQEVTVGSRSMLAARRPTKGYQGYFGLSWSGVALRWDTVSARGKAKQSTEDSHAIARSTIVSDALKHIFGRASAIDTDLHLIGINGRIAADREHNRVLPAVLTSVREIGESIRNAVHSVIGDLYGQARHNLDREAAQMAALGVNIMDRNLYERANDCRWWALIPAFRRILSGHGGDADTLSKSERDEIAAILAYVNGLYTVYSLLIVFDRQGRLIAESRGGGIVGQVLSGPHISDALRNRDPQRYSVSPFAATPLYGGRPTYVYCGTILSVAGDEPVGGVAVVFDSEPQFRQMLLDVMPHRDDGEPYAGSFAAFLNRDGVLISSTGADHRPGGRLDLRALRNFTIVARRASPGYREFKRSDGYVDPVECVIAIPD